MPASHEYEGACGFRFYKFFRHAKTARIPSKIKCPCGVKTCTAEILWGSPPKNYAYVKGVVYYENVKGEIRVPADPSDPNPGKGWQRKEIGLMNEIRQLEKRVNAQEMSKGSAFREVAHMAALEKQKAERDYIFSGDMVPVRELPNGDIEYKHHPGFNHWSEAGKDFARAAMEASNARLVRETRQIDPEIHFNLLHNDARRR